MRCGALMEPWTIVALALTRIAFACVDVWLQGEQ